MIHRIYTQHTLNQGSRIDLQTHTGSVTLNFDILTSWPVDVERLPCCLSTNFGVDSTSRFSFTNIQSFTTTEIFTIYGQFSSASYALRVCK